MVRISTGLTVAAAATTMLATFLPTADAYAKYAMKLPNGDSVPDAPNIGHVDAAGMGGLSDFGKDWSKLGKGGWTPAYCQADSDGDGFTNGQELGDPCCTWTPTSAASLITDGISNPTDKTKTPTNPKLQSKCAAAGGGAAAGGASNSTGAGGAAGAGAELGPGTVNAGPRIPEDDDEDDNDETETLAPVKSSASRAVATVLVSVACSAAAALMW